jgi:GrpB-like predicted nucleotidyltransferase (UPF0157 family)
LPIVVPYDPEWELRFEVEAAMLERVLAPWLDGGIHHIGSTAVPGLAAKPIIDILAGVRELEEARAAFVPLESLGYAWHSHRPEAHAFFKPAGGSEHTHHLHLTTPGSDIWNERIAFRDALLEDPELVEEYAAWKRRHADGTSARDPYAGDKRPLVGRVLAARGIDLKPDAERLSRAVAKRRPGPRTRR